MKKQNKELKKDNKDQKLFINRLVKDGKVNLKGDKISIDREIVCIEVLDHEAKVKKQNDTVAVGLNEKI